MLCSQGDKATDKERGKSFQHPNIKVLPNWMRSDQSCYFMARNPSYMSHKLGLVDLQYKSSQYFMMEIICLYCLSQLLTFSNC